MAHFIIDEDTAADGYLYVDVDDIATLIIRRTSWDSGVHVEICVHGHAGEPAVKTVRVSADEIHRARAAIQRKNRT